MTDSTLNNKSTNLLPNWQLLCPQTTEEFAAYYLLRWQLLRAPWQQPKGSEQDLHDDGAYHLMLKNAQDVIAVGRLHTTSPTQAQIRYMAVADAYQRQGHGNTILQALERHAIDNNIKAVMLNARENAIGFYAANGYQIEAPAHTLYGSIKHVKMCKTLA